jgi:hypothetical protein
MRGLYLQLLVKEAVGRTPLGRRLHHMRMRSTEAAHGASGQTYKLGVEMR